MQIFFLWNFTQEIDGMYFPDYPAFFKGFISKVNANKLHFRIDTAKWILLFVWFASAVIVLRGILDMLFSIIKFIAKFIGKKV